MQKAIKDHFFSAAVAFLLACVCVLFLACACTFEPSNLQGSSKLRAEVLSALLR